MFDYLRVEHIKIQGIWKKYTVDFKLDPDVNILVGDNGLGKTTILEIVYAITIDSIDINPRISAVFSSADIEFSEDYTVSVRTDENGEKKTTWRKNDNVIEYKTVPLLTEAVSTFDAAPYPEFIKDKIKSSHLDAVSELDIAVYDYLNSFYKYKSSVSNNFRNLVVDNKIDEAKKLYEPYDRMKDIFSQLYSDKEWYENDGMIQFKSTSDGDILNASQLSSGEKQMLILLISTIIQSGRRFITFWDEPEISLHIAWQQQLITIMREFNPNIQLIIATHSPSILYQGWESRAININDIRVRE